MMTEKDAAARRRGFAAASPITEAIIERQVHGFYAKVRADPVLGPIFNAVIAEEDWPAHLAKLCDFWSSVTLMSGRFKGSPMAAHMRVEAIQPAHFDRWLSLFEQTARELCPPEAADIFVEKSRMIGRSLLIGLQMTRGGLSAALTP